MSRIRRPSPALVVASLALLVALGGVTYAAIPGPDGTIHSCIGQRGSLRVIDSAASCDNNEQALAFAQQGPQGATGPAGESRLLKYAADGSVRVPRKAGMPVGSFDLPEGNWVVSFTGGVKIPTSNALSINFTRGQKAGAAALNSYRAFSWGANVMCVMTVGDGSVRQTVGNSALIGLLLPAVHKQRAQQVSVNLQLVHRVPAGGERGFLACSQGKDKAGFSSPDAVLHDISIHAVKVGELGDLTFTPGR